MKKGKFIAVGVAAVVAIGIALPSNSEPETVKTPTNAIVEKDDGIFEESIVVANPEQSSADMPISTSSPSTSVDSEQTTEESLIEYNYVGSTKSNKYHEPDCRWAKEINEENLVGFDTKKDAEVAGYLPCKTCSPN